MEIGRLDNQRITFPLALRTAEPLIDSRVRIAERDDPRIMVHLYIDEDVLSRLHELVSVVVHHVDHRRPAGGAKADEAALGHRTRLRTVERVANEVQTVVERLLA